MSADAASTVLVGFDGSPAAQAAVRHAAREVGAGGLLVVAHALHPDAAWASVEASSAGPDERELSAQRTRGEAVLAGLDVAALDGVAYETVLVRGTPATALLALARERDVAKVVVGTGRGVARGRVALALVRQADRPVEVVPA